MPTLDDPQLEKFALAYAGHRNAAKAAIEAGYPASMAMDVLHANHAVGARVRELWGQAVSNAGVSAERVIQEIARVAFQSVRDLYDSGGELIHANELNDDVAATVVGLEQETRFEKGADGEGRPVVTRKYKRADKMAALTLLAKHFKVVGDEGDGVNALASALADRLKEGRKRAFDTSQAEDATLVPPKALHHVPAGEDPLTGARLHAPPDFVPATVYDSADDPRLQPPRPPRAMVVDSRAALVDDGGPLG